MDVAEPAAGASLGFDLVAVPELVAAGLVACLRADAWQVDDPAGYAAHPAEPAESAVPGRRVVVRRLAAPDSEVGRRAAPTALVLGVGVGVGVGPDVVGESLRLGYRAVLDPADPPEVLVSAAACILSGAGVLSAAALEQLAHPRPPYLPGDALSSREADVLGLIGDGLTHAQTARRLGLRKSTIDTYVARLKVKLRLTSKAQLTKAALAFGVTEPVPEPEIDA